MTSPDPQPNPLDFLYHRPLSIRVLTVARLPSERDLPAHQTLMTLNLGLSRASAQTLIDLLTAQLQLEHQDLITVTILGTSP